MHKDFLDKLVEHGNGQLVEVLVLVNQSDKTISVLFVLLIALDSLFQSRDFGGMILSRLVDTIFSRISLTMLPVPNPHNTACVLSWEEARHWQSRSSDYSSS